jgi:hypothetical protein
MGLSRCTSSRTYMASALAELPRQSAYWERHHPHLHTVAGGLRANVRRSTVNTDLFVYRHPRDYTGTPGTFAAWQAWFDELGDALVDLGNPVLEDRGAAGQCGSALPLGGYTLINADDMDEAQHLAGRCPIVSEGGAVEIGRLSPVPGREHPARTF